MSHPITLARGRVLRPGLGFSVVLLGLSLRALRRPEMPSLRRLNCVLEEVLEFVALVVTLLRGKCLHRFTQPITRFFIN